MTRLALLGLTALLFTGCASYTRALYGEGPASAAYTECMHGLGALVGGRLYLEPCMKRAGWERIPGSQPEGPAAYRPIGGAR